MEENHEDNSDKSSVEESLSKDYIPKGKLKGLPISQEVSAELKEKMKKSQKEIEDFKNELVKKYKFVEAVGIVPAQASKILEEEFEISEEDSKRGLIHLLVLIPEKHFKSIKEIRLDSINIAKKHNSKLWVHLLTPVDIWNLGLDSKFSVMESLSMSYPVFDKGILGSLRVSQIHKSLVLRKFEKYVTSYVIAGSLIRGEAVKTSDVDVFVVIDDTDVKRMPRLELKEKLRSFIHAYIQEAQAMAGVKNILNVQIYLLTEFWDAVKDAHPVMFTFIRDGIPLYDRGAFLPWKSLLRMGKIKPSPEAIDMFMSSGNKLKEIVNRRIFDIAILDLFHGVSTPTQGLLMLYGQSPGTIPETVKSFRQTFVEKEKMITEEYADILEEIMIKYYKGYEHGKVKPGDIDGKELDRLSTNALKYIKRLKELREQIEKRKLVESIKLSYKEVFDVLKTILKKNSEKDLLKEFNKTFVKKGKLPSRLESNLKFIIKTKENINKKPKEEKNKDFQLMKKRKDVEDSRKFASEIIKDLIEYSQRKEFVEMDKTRFIIKGKSESAEVFFLNNTFIVQGSSIKILKGGKLVNSNPEELKRQLLEHKDSKSEIDFEALKLLKKTFGDFKLIY
ncbi:hypothetical protein COU54_05535 [Candidatus Pacearchaeota archaeon CG10_big_fil_rev_8_21_14_0_10_31_24]|nr:MAG: hypothetical protein COU54_05535 [Candidatus Pacearchaeota archaeon CG10_big_fil_rev_8_21_14_0_10_31_24]